MRTIQIQVALQRDELGEPEEFSWDLFPVVDTALTLHLDQNGLPKKGTVIRPGMIVVGKIGKSSSYDPLNEPDAREIHCCEFAELSSKYGHMWRDTSYYARPEDCGTVEDAWIEGSNPAKGVVVIQQE